MIGSGFQFDLELVETTGEYVYSDLLLRHPCCFMCVHMVLDHVKLHSFVKLFLHKMYWYIWRATT